MENERKRALVVDDHEGLRTALARELRETHDVVTARCVADAIAHLHGNAMDVVVTDLQLDDGDGLEILDAARRMSPLCRRVLVTGATLDPRIDTALARKLAHRFVSKPWLAGQIRLAVESGP